MVDIIGPAANQATSTLTGVKKADSTQSKQKSPLIASSSPDMIDEVSISNEAMDIGRVMEIVQSAKSRVESDPQITLSNGGELLDRLV